MGTLRGAFPGAADAGGGMRGGDSRRGGHGSRAGQEHLRQGSGAGDHRDRLPRRGQSARPLSSAQSRKIVEQGGIRAREVFGERPLFRLQGVRGARADPDRLWRQRRRGRRVFRQLLLPRLSRCLRSGRAAGPGRHRPRPRPAVRGRRTRGAGRRPIVRRRHVAGPGGDAHSRRRRGGEFRGRQRRQSGEPAGQPLPRRPAGRDVRGLRRGDRDSDALAV